MKMSDSRLRHHAKYSEDKDGCILTRQPKEFGRTSKTVFETLPYLAYSYVSMLKFFIDNSNGMKN